MINLKIDNYIGIGDKLQFSHIPENLFHYTGMKVCDLNNCWIFDHNPYVTRTEKYKITLDLWSIVDMFPKEGFKSRAEQFFILFNKIFKTNYSPILIHPRLYFNENAITKNIITVHTTGKTEKTPMQDHIINHIYEKYKNDYTIIQVGGLNDKQTPFISRLGLNMWDTVKLISESRIFIGINSGLSHIPNCYPSIYKKICLSDNIDYINFLPMSLNNDWFHYNISYFNRTEYDIGCTLSYLKI